MTRYFYRVDKQTTYRHMKKYSTSLIIKEIKTEITRYDITQWKCHILITSGNSQELVRTLNKKKGKGNALFAEKLVGVVIMETGMEISYKSKNRNSI